MGLLGLIGEEGGLSLSSYIQSLSGLVAYYPLDETSGNALNKAPATIGTLDGTVTGATQGQPGQSGLAYSFDGVNDEVALTNNAIFQLTAGSLGVLIKPAVDIGALTKATLSKENAYALFLDAENFKTYSWAGSVGFRDSGVNVVTDQIFHYISMTFQSGVVNGTKLYVDGVLKLTTTITIQSNGQALYIGRSAISSHPFKGLMQHAFISSGLLSDAQHLRISQLAGLA